MAPSCGLGGVRVRLPAQAIGNAEQGRERAEQWCNRCLAVLDTALQPTTDGAPPFAAIVKDPEMTPGRVAVFLQAPHPP